MNPSVVVSSIAIACLAPLASAQTFERALGIGLATERSNAVIGTASGGAIITGTDTSSGASAPYVAFVDPASAITSHAYYTGPGERVVQDVLESPIGGAVCSVGASDTPGFGRGLFHVDQSGVVLWSRAFEGSDVLADIKLDHVPGGGYIFSGAHQPSGAQTTHPVLTRVNDSGALVWSNVYFHNTLGSDLFAVFDDVCAFTEPADDGTERLFFLACGRISTTNAPNTQGRALVMRLDETGGVVWASSYGFPDNVLLEATNVERAPNGDIILSGNDLSIGTGDSCLLRLDSSGALLWMTGYQNFGTSGALTRLPSGELLMCGRTRNPAIPAGQAETVLLKTDASGALQWAHAFGGAGFTFGSDAAPIPGGLVAIGTKLLNNPSGTADIQWIRTDAAGNTGCETPEPIVQISRSPDRRAEPFEGDVLDNIVLLNLNRRTAAYTSDELCETPPCPSCAWDFAPPLGVGDFSDVVAFLGLFGAMDPCADLAAPIGVFDFSDVVAFLGSFGDGCP